MSAQFSLGIEEEFQMVDRSSGQLSPHIQVALEKGTPILGEKIKPEMLQSAVEIITDVCPDISAARSELRALRRTVQDLLSVDNKCLIAAGTHPDGLWQEQIPTTQTRYNELEDELQDVARSILIFGLHVHVGVENQQMAVILMNQARTWLPQMLALSSNSPFWGGRFTGMKSYRSVVWRAFPRNGIPEIFPEWHDFNTYVEALIKGEFIDNGKRIWWDIRPHPFFNTLEFRIFDMQTNLEETLALAALCQALVAKLTWLQERGQSSPVLARALIEENKWKAIRYGLDGTIIDFPTNRRLTMRESISELLAFVDDVVDDLGSRHEIDYVHSMLADPRGIGADRQMEVYRQAGNVQAVIDYLRDQTMLHLEGDEPALQRPAQ